MSCMIGHSIWILGTLRCCGYKKGPAPFRNQAPLFTLFLTRRARKASPSGLMITPIRDQFAVVEDVHRPAAVVREGLGRVDAAGAVDRAEHLRRGVAAVGGYSPRGWRADGLAHSRPPPAIMADMTGAQ